MLATCLGCGCACDDIQLRIEANRILEARNACDLGARWFGDGGAGSHARVEGEDVSVDSALDAATAILSDAWRPLVFLAPDISCEAQRAAIAIADVLHGSIDSVTTSTAIATVLAAQEAGRASATLGEIRNRADVLVFWGVDTGSRYPRFASRYAPEPPGLHVTGRSGRTVIAVDVGSSRGPDDADLRVPVVSDREVATLIEFTAAVSEQNRERPARNELLDAILKGKYVAIIVDAEATEESSADHGRAAALIAFAQALNGPTRCALVSLRGGGNRSGADACLTAQTGYPMAVDFARGHPRYRPYHDAAARLDRGVVDAALVIGSTSLVPPRLTDAMARVPAVAIGPRATAGAFSRARVAIDTGTVGIHESGTALRMDDVPLPLPAAVSGPPPTVELVAQLAGRLRALRR
jgi:formylmethanofuran dehydrogenase subunit B